MTERELDQKIEQWAGQLEERLERGAGRFERDLTTAWEERPAFRRLCRGLSLAAGAGLLGGRLPPAAHRTPGVGPVVRPGRNRGHPVGARLSPAF